MELIALRLGTAWLAKHGVHNMPGHIDTVAVGSPPAAAAIGTGPQATDQMLTKEKMDDTESGYGDASEETPAAAQILGVAILEFGVIFHSVCPSLRMKDVLG